jgi:hypothetical protein
VRRLGGWCVLVLCIGAALTIVSPLDAASFTLSSEERDAAIRAGKRSVISERFGREWTVGGDGPGQTVLVMTPFHRLALAARNAAFRNQELRPKDIESVLKEQTGGLALWATLKGNKNDFARFYTAVLTTGEQEVKPSFSQNERTALREEDGSYTARCMYVFPSDGLRGNGTLTLIVKDPDEKAVAKFTMDLSAMR